jgi:hypothetical protein
VIRWIAVVLLLMSNVAWPSGTSRTLDADVVRPSDHSTTFYLASYQTELSQSYAGFVGGSAISGYSVWADINAAVAAVSAGARVLIVANLTLNSTQQITVANTEWVCLPGVTISKGSATTGVQLSAAGIKMRGCRLSGFGTAGDKAILIDAGSNYSTIADTRFSGNVTDISDANGKTSAVGLVNE